MHVQPTLGAGGAKLDIGCDTLEDALYAELTAVSKDDTFPRGVPHVAYDEDAGGARLDDEEEGS